MGNKSHLSSASGFALPACEAQAPFPGDPRAPRLTQGRRSAGRGPPRRLLAHARPRRRRRAGRRSRKCPWSRGPRAGRRCTGLRAWPGARLGTLEPPASVAEAVSSLTIADAFVEAGESPDPPPALPRRFICSFPDCSASYNKAWKLDAHLCKHTGERPFVCDHEGCGKAFVRDYHLSRHILIHTGEKPFVCAAVGCDQKFNTKSNLKKHFERKHENQQKQYVCNFEGCKKTFKKHQQLKTHQCQHTNEPLFKLYLSKRMFFCGKNMDRTSETCERNP
uniref:Transcription factor IIIA n=1 Tax=Prolemur simus TaxID=1328070 RepID=A0A8C9AJG6_PROSS